MKKAFKTVALLTLALALMLAQAAVAEPSDAVKGVYDALLAEGSSYSQTKAVYAEYYPDAAFEETLEGDGFTIAVTGSEDMDGSWTFTRDGDALTATFESGDYLGASMVPLVVNAVGGYLGLDTDLVNSYVNGLTLLNIESDVYAVDRDEATGATTVRIGIAAPWEMKELDGMVLNEQALTFIEPLGEDSRSTGMSVGKLMMICNGSADDATILLGEHAALDELAYQSVVNAVNVLKPNGWEDFAANYTELADAEGAGWSVRLDVERAEVDEIIEDAKDSFHYAIIRFGE